MQAKVLFLAGALATLSAGWIGFPEWIFNSRPQPVEFSHKTHADKAGSKCEDCHAFREDGTYAGIPTLEQCGGCHMEPMGPTTAEKHFIEKYVTASREPEWLPYARQPENVYFPHGPHVKLAKISCEQCHGDQGTSDKLKPYQENRISGYSRDVLPVRTFFRRTSGRVNSMSMDDCIACHRQNELEHSCLDCHK